MVFPQTWQRSCGSSFTILSLVVVTSWPPQCPHDGQTARRRRFGLLFSPMPAELFIDPSSGFRGQFHSGQESRGIPGDERDRCTRAFPGWVQSLHRPQQLLRIAPFHAASSAPRSSSRSFRSLSTYFLIWESIDLMTTTSPGSITVTAIDLSSSSDRSLTALFFTVFLVLI